MATIGYKAAVADAFKVKVTGPIAYLMWLFIHVMYLVGWGNRVGTLYTWARAFLFSGGRAHRIITYENASAEITHGRTRAINPATDLPTGDERRPKRQT